MNSGPIINNPPAGYESPFKNPPRPPTQDEEETRLKQGVLTEERIKPLTNNPGTPKKIAPPISDLIQPRGVGERLNIVA